MHAFFNDGAYAFRLSFLNKCDELERQTVARVSISLLCEETARKRCKPELG